MDQQDRGITPVISTILMVAIVVILAATVSVSFLGVAEDSIEPAPNVADTTGEFAVTPPGETAGSKQIVRITHIAGEGVAVSELEIVVRASGPSLDTTARLVSLPADDTTVDGKNIEGNKGLITKNKAVQVIQEDDSNVWSAGQTIAFRINTGEADFREPPKGGNPNADELEVIIVHTPSNAIISENTFRP